MIKKNWRQVSMCVWVSRAEPQDRVQSSQPVETGLTTAWGSQNRDKEKISGLYSSLMLPCCLLILGPTGIIPLQIKVFMLSGKTPNEVG